MNDGTLRASLVFFSLLGLADSVYLAMSEISGTALTCDIQGLDGCNQVAQSPYSHLFGIPLGVYGVLFYGALFVLAFLIFRFRSSFFSRALLFIAALGALLSLWFIYIQAVLIKALCVYCLGSAVLSFLLLPFAYIAWRRFGQVPSPKLEPVVP